MFARAHQRLGLAGLAAPVLVATALVSGALAWREHRRVGAEPVVSAAPPATMVHSNAAGHLPLRPVSDVPLLLTRMERAALEQGLGWPHAEYRLNAATEDSPASLEVHCTLQGPYPKIRRFVTALLQDSPALTLREFSLVRANVDASDVEAKLGVVVYLASGPVPSGPSTGVAP
jgi:hypothetical protein